MPASDKPHLLILGGTAEARELAAALAVRFSEALRLTTSLAGRTRHPAALAGEVRRGGFGGAAGLVEYLDATRVDFVIDATHPFARRISATAREACRACAVPLLVLARPRWVADPADRWIMAEDAATAAALLLQQGRRAFLTIGRNALDAFAVCTDVHFVVRLVDPPTAPLPLGSYDAVIGRGPFGRDAERSIMRRHAIDVVVAKESGGIVMPAKLEAARDLGLPVIMLRRPPDEGGECVARVEEAVAWLARRLEIRQEVVL